MRRTKTAQVRDRLGRIEAYLIGVFVAIALFGIVTKTSGDEVSAESTWLVVAPSDGPSEDLKHEMQCWSCQSETVLSEIRSSWTGVALAIGQGGDGRIEGPCRRFRSDVAVLLANPPPPAPDPITWIYLSRAITLIRKATENCTEKRIFALSHSLWKARQMFREVDQRLAVLEAGSCAVVDVSRKTCGQFR